MTQKLAVAGNTTPPGPRRARGAGGLIDHGGRHLDYSRACPLRHGALGCRGDLLDRLHQG